VPDKHMKEIVGYAINFAAFFGLKKYMKWFEVHVIATKIISKPVQNEVRCCPAVKLIKYIFLVHLFPSAFLIIVPGIKITGAGHYIKTYSTHS
jgi:hypothetical protein